MKKLAMIMAAAGVILVGGTVAQGTWYTFEFSEEDLWDHTPSADTRLYNQDAPRRHHTVWKGDVQTTDSTQPNQAAYQTTAGTSGWYQSATYDSWLNVGGGGPVDNSGNPFGICQVQLWGAGWANSRLAWNERYKVNAGAAAWQILQTPTGWTGTIIDNPWDDDGSATPLDQYFINWDADSYASDRILYSTYGNAVDDYVFKFKVDIVGEYATTLEPSPDGDPEESDGSMRIWFAGFVVDWDAEGEEEKYLYEDGHWYTWDELPGLPEGFGGIIPEPGTMVVLGLGGLGVLIRRRRRRA